MKAETKFKVKVQAWLRAYYPRCYAVKIQQVGLRGTPDMLVCIHGLFVALELKREQKAKIDTLQIHTLNQIAMAGGFAAVVYPENFDEVKVALVAWLGKRSRKGVLCGIEWTPLAS